MTTTQQSNTAKEPDSPPPPGTALGIAAFVLSYFVPGMGHICVGEKKRGLLFMFTIHGLFALGLLLAGIRAIGPQEQPIWSITQYLAGWPTLVAAPFAKNVEAGLEESARAYIDAYSTKFAGLRYSHEPRQANGSTLPISVSRDGDVAVQSDPSFTEAEKNEALKRRTGFSAEYNKSHGTSTYNAKVYDVGAVYCGIAGMLNLLVMFDVVLKVTGNVRHPPEKNEADKKQDGGGGA